MNPMNPMNHEATIDYLNSAVCVRIAPSKIHGVGIMAIRELPKGKRLYLDNLPQTYELPYANFGKLFKEVRAIVVERWPGVVNGSRFAYPDSRYQAYMNHSDDPNYDIATDTLIKDMKEGEEITENYRKIEGWEKAFPFLKTNN